MPQNSIIGAVVREYADARLHYTEGPTAKEDAIQWAFNRQWLIDAHDEVYDVLQEFYPRETVRVGEYGVWADDEGAVHVVMPGSVPVAWRALICGSCG